MYLKKAFWSDGLKLNSQTESSSCSSAVGEVVKSLEKERLYGEVTLALRSGINDARAEFSFLRLHALRTLLNFLRSVAASYSTVSLFSHSQSFPE